MKVIEIVQPMAIEEKMHVKSPKTRLNYLYILQGGKYDNAVEFHLRRQDDNCVRKFV